MRVLIFHGYLLGGTGSNVYNARLAEALRRLGHEVHLLCQDRHPEAHRFVDAVGDWDGGALEVRELRPLDAAGGSCTVYRPDIGTLLPVYVADRYEGLEARTFADCSEAEVASYVERNVLAVRDVVARVGPELALANHLVMGPLVLARALGEGVPYAVKVHGSALEYTVKREPERFLAAAQEGLAHARGVLVGSLHTAESLWRALGDPQLPARTRLGPPGVDVRRFAPREPDAASRELRSLAQRLSTAKTPDPAQAQDSAFARDSALAGRELARLEPERDRLVAYVGKLIVSKGVDLLLAAWPLVLAREPRARLVVVGFGGYRDAFERLLGALAQGDLAQAEQLALAGRSLELDAAAAARSEAPPLRHLLAFLRGLDGSERAHYLEAARRLPERVVMTGRLEHDELAEVLPACEAVVVPSTFPEAFGMVAAEAAACGALPVSAAHSGLAEVSRELAAAVGPALAPLLSFTVDDGAVRALAASVAGWLATDERDRQIARERLVERVRERWSWDGVAEGVIAAAQGRLGSLAEP